MRDQPGQCLIQRVQVLGGRLYQGLGHFQGEPAVVTAMFVAFLAAGILN